MIYTACIKSEDKGISRGILQGTREINPNEQVFYDSSNGQIYQILMPNQERKVAELRSMHCSFMGGDLSNFIYVLYEHPIYKDLEEIIKKFIFKVEEIPYEPIKEKKNKKA